MDRVTDCISFVSFFINCFSKYQNIVKKEVYYGNHSYYGRIHGPSITLKLSTDVSVDDELMSLDILWNRLFIIVVSIRCVFKVVMERVRVSPCRYLFWGILTDCTLNLSVLLN